jgi:hypothetical protein
MEPLPTENRAYRSLPLEWLQERRKYRRSVSMSAVVAAGRYRRLDSFPENRRAHHRNAQDVTAIPETKRLGQAVSAAGCGDVPSSAGIERRSRLFLTNGMRTSIRTIVTEAQHIQGSVVLCHNPR